MTRKPTVLAAAALLSLAIAHAQETVPRHEFFVEGFGGMGPLLYQVQSPSLDREFHSAVWPWQAGYGSLVSIHNPFAGNYKLVQARRPSPADRAANSSYLTTLGYGGGFGYIWHFHPNVGLMTGAEFAVYNGGIDLEQMGDTNPIGHLTSQDVKTSREEWLLLTSIGHYKETQKLMVVQIPLMLHVMAPMGRGWHHFYAAAGAKLGINVVARYKGEGEMLKAVWQAWPDPVITGIDATRPGTYSPSDLFDDSGLEPTVVDETLESAGVFEFKRLNAIASAELGFRWHLKNGWGLYTGLYADYGFLGVNKMNGRALVGMPAACDLQKQLPSEPNSILNAQAAPGYTVSENPGNDNQPYRYSYGEFKGAAGKAGTLGAGLKLKIAFGKVKKQEAPVIPVLPPEPQKPDTVVKTVVQTIVVRDTVVQNNTVVVRDTVEKVNTVVVRDTVVVIKEIPQEIKDVMVELSNTLFAFNKFNLSDKAREGLDKVAGWLNENPDVQVEISGHTDNVGSDSYNQKLSEQRAKSVYEYFIHDGGVSSKRLSYKGYGKTRPIASNDTEEGRQQNRRVELNIIQ